MDFVTRRNLVVMGSNPVVDQNSQIQNGGSGIGDHHMKFEKTKNLKRVELCLREPGPLEPSKVYF